MQAEGPRVLGSKHLSRFKILLENTNDFSDSDFVTIAFTQKPIPTMTENFSSSALQKWKDLDLQWEVQDRIKRWP